MGSLSINNYRSTLEIRTTNSKIQIRTPKPKFRIKRTPPQMTVIRRMPTFKVNYQKVRAESGLGGPEAMRQEMYSRAHSKTMDAIANIAQTGDYLMRIEHSDGTDMIAQVAFNNMQAAIPEINIGSMPQSLPEVEWDHGEFKIVWSEGSFELEWDTDFRPDISFTPHSVEIKIRNYPKINVQDNNHSRNRVDREI